MEKTDKPLTRDALVSMQVIDAKGRLLGKVKDVAFAVGKMGISLTVENEDGETQNVAWEEVQAAADFIILKPQMVQQNTYQPQQQPAQTGSSSSPTRSAVNSTALSNMWQTFNLDSAIPTMVLLQRQKIRLKAYFFQYFYFLKFLHFNICLGEPPYAKVAPDLLILRDFFNLFYKNKLFISKPLRYPYIRFGEWYCK